ncbi:MAG: Sir2 family NAD-dependent protein deacetylase [Bacteroidales bacterium]|nr:Sir2 family NAD-dependent protein deacetylase [Bacteroidales bacterium]
MKNLVISTGAGISAESGITTFRDAGGLWENYKVMDVASDEGFARNPALIHRFYNERRKQLLEVEPNAAHRGLVALEQHFNVNVITQNVDDLHERAGSKNVLHLHGELMKVRSMRHDDRIYTLPSAELSDKGLETSVDTVDAHGDHVRPHIVFFGEAVPNFDAACRLASQADIFVVIGTTLVVYPAAALLQYAPKGAEVYYIDPNPAAVPPHVHVIAKKATEGVAELIQILTNK